MAIDDEICAAVRKGLADWLRAQVAPQFGTDQGSNPNCVVREKWAQNRQQLADYDITVLTTGTADDWWLFPPSAKQTTLVAQAQQAGVIYSYGWIDGLQLTLDLFGATQQKRDQIGRAARNALNVPPWVSAPAVVPQPNYLVLPHQNGLVLQLTTFFNTVVEYEFPPFAAPVENANVAQAGEWRSTMQGKASLFIRDQVLFTALKRLHLVINTGTVVHTKQIGT